MGEGKLGCWAVANTTRVRGSIIWSAFQGQNRGSGGSNNVMMLESAMMVWHR